MNWPLAVPLFLLLMACPKKTEVTTMSKWAPTPYTADQIRDAMPTDTRLVFRVTLPERTEVWDWRVTEATPDSVVFLYKTIVPGGGPEASTETSARSLWSELRDHARFEREALTVTRHEAKVAAGAFEAHRYTVETTTDAGATSIKYMDFAVDVAGPPVYMEHLIDGQRVMTMELMSRDPLIRHTPTP
ncbi:MAG: hypothetical protein ACON5B_17035 [Myxococcota bacterium]